MRKWSLSPKEMKEFEQLLDKTMKERYAFKNSDAPLCEAFKEYCYQGDNFDYNNQIIYRFPNRYGASVIEGRGSDGMELMELYFEHDNSPEYFFGGPSIPHLTPERLEEVLREIYNRKP